MFVRNVPRLGYLELPVAPEAAGVFTWQAKTERYQSPLNTVTRYLWPLTPLRNSAMGAAALQWLRGLLVL